MQGFVGYFFFGGGGGVFKISGFGHGLVKGITGLYKSLTEVLHMILLGEVSTVWQWYWRVSLASEVLIWLNT